MGPPPGLQRTDGESSPPATGAVVTTLARGAPRLILTSDTDTLLPSTDTDTTSERGALRLILPTDTDTDLLSMEDTLLLLRPGLPRVSRFMDTTDTISERGVLRPRLSLRPMLTTDTDTVSDTDTIWDTMVWDTPMVDTMAMDTVMDMDTATMDKPGACAIYF